ncbi:MAG: hypothetical protein K9G62_03795, partial [Alphaproteobacteria bacterium]|nr:hypothetical protein [Alphaproteobacteria bacterium]
MIKEIEDSTVFKAFKEAGKLNYFQGLQAYEIAKHGVALDLDDSVNGLKIQLTNLGGDTAPLVAKLKAQTLREFKQTLNEAATEFRKKEDKEFIGMLDDLQRIRQSMTP